LLHVGFKVAAGMGKRFTGALEANEEIVGRNVTRNLFERHLIKTHLRMKLPWRKSRGTNRPDFASTPFHGADGVETLDPSVGPKPSPEHSRNYDFSGENGRKLLYR
jgi:hypothetical protein